MGLRPYGLFKDGSNPNCRRAELEHWIALSSTLSSTCGVFMKEGDELAIRRLLLFQEASILAVRFSRISVTSLRPLSDLSRRGYEEVTKR